MVEIWSPYMAVAKDATSAMHVKIPRTVPTEAACEKELPFVITAEKQPISDSVALSKIRSMN